MSALLLVVEDEERLRELYAQTLERAGFEVLTASSAAEALAALGQRDPAMVVSDVRLPGEGGIELLRKVRGSGGEMPFLLVTAFPAVRDAVDALKLGAVDYLEKPLDLDELVSAVADTVGVASGGSEAPLPGAALEGIVAESPGFREVLARALQVSHSDATVLLEGESGSGKEVVARLIHRQSHRAGGPFVAVNCAALPEGLLASELFGHVKGAFTGATSSRPGRFREAEGGTLFLDEIGDMPLELQALLLRAIETRLVTPVGGTGEREVDIRLLAATNRDLRREVEAGRFREDLFYRIHVISLRCPPLRERPEDLLPLARFFLAGGSSSKRLSPAAAAAVQTYTWPGNVRELANAIACAKILASTDVVLPEHLPESVRGCAGMDAAPPFSGDERVVPLETVARRTIEDALRKTKGNQTRAAKLLGISRGTLINKLRRYRLQDEG